MSNALEAATALATAAAAGIAAWAVISANGTARRSREHQRLAERYDLAVGLLTALEEAEALHQTSPWGEKFPEARLETLRAAEVAAARLRGLLHASEEPLPIARAILLYTAPKPGSAGDERAMLAAAPALTSTGSDRELVAKARAEIVGVIAGLRSQLNG